MNNFYKLKSYIDNLEVDDFLYIEIMIRNKDQKDNIGKNNRIIKSYKVDILTDLNRLEEDIKKLCKTFNARAYIYLSPRNNEKVFSEMLLLMANYNKMKNYDSINRVFDKALKSIKGSMKHFIIDIDTKDLNYVTNVREEIINSAKLDSIEAPLIDIFETNSGYHIITKPFNYYKTFKDKFPDIEIHKNNPTLLYYDGKV